MRDARPYTLRLKWDDLPLKICTAITAGAVANPDRVEVIRTALGLGRRASRCAQGCADEAAQHGCPERASVAAGWQLSRDQLGDEAKSLLSLLAVLPPDGVREAWFCADRLPADDAAFPVSAAVRVARGSEAYAALEQMIVSGAVDATLAELEDLSLVSRGKEGDEATVAMHRLLQDVVVSGGARERGAVEPGVAMATRLRVDGLD